MQGDLVHTLHGKDEPSGLADPILCRCHVVCAARKQIFGQYPVVVGDFVMSKDRHVTGGELLQSSDVIFLCGFQ